MKKKGMKHEAKIQITLILITIFIITLVYYFVQPAFIGYTVLQGYKINISNSSNFIYDDKEIGITEGIIKLKANMSSANWTTYSQEIFPIAKAYYDYEDKTSKVESQDGNKQETNSNETAVFIFSTDLSNGDIINLYLDDEEATNIYLCKPYEGCTSSSNLGQFYFPNQEGYYQITLQNLNHSSKIFSLNPDGEIKLDFINASNANITKFWYDPSDKISEVNSQDNATLEIDEDKLFDIVFNEELQNNNIIQLYLKNEEVANIYLCNAGDECTSTNLGQINFPNQEGYYNITMQNLNTDEKAFNINADEKLKVDFIEAIRVTETNHSETNITYPLAANITTQDFTVENLMYWDVLITEEELSSQSINYEYSIDSGESWQPVQEDKNLSEVNSTKIRIKAILNSNGTATPSISLLNITYAEKEPQTYFEINDTALISTIENDNITINSTASKIELSIIASETLSNIQLNISELRDARPSNLSRLKEIEILSEQLQNKISAATIKVYYTEDEIKNLNESTLKLYYYNETSESWQGLGSIVNTEENYIRADLQHFSIYGVFGEEINSESSSSSSDSGGPGGKREFTRGTTTPQQTPQEQESSASEAGEETKSPQEETEQEIIQTETQASEQSALTGNIVNIGKVLTEGKTNRSLWILIAILIVAYIIAKIEEKK